MTPFTIPPAVNAPQVMLDLVETFREYDGTEAIPTKR